MKKTYLWTEDRKNKSGFLFWKMLMQYLFPHIIVESKSNNSGLIKAVRNLEDEENEYIVAFDQSFDNIQVVREHQLLQKQIAKKNNVHELRIICFEYILLEFEKLIDWIYAPEDEFLERRATEIVAREKLLIALKENKDYKQLSELQNYTDKLDSLNIEQLSAKLLFDLTRNTGFEVSKGKIGDCWVLSCCDWKERQENDICGLDSTRKTAFEKMKEITDNTTLKLAFEKIGLEVAE